MKFKFVLAAAVATLAIPALGATSASAATQAGNSCVGNEGNFGIDFTLVGLSNGAGNPFPAAIPVSGVVTKWTFNVVSEVDPGLFSQRLKIFRATGAPQQYQVVGESAPGVLFGGLNTFSTRIPVRAGDLIGGNGTAEGEPLTIFCLSDNPGDRAGIILGSAPLNSTATVEEEESELQVPIIVFVEPDADYDGFGDETQDACPQSAALQTPCPLVALSTSTQVKKGSVTILVTSTTAAPVSVKGVARLGKGKKAKMNGGTQNLLPGTINKYRLFFTKGLKNKLKELSSQKKVTLKVTISGASVSGAVTTKTLKVKLKGQGPKS